MEESKITPVIFSVNKESTLSEDNIKEYLADPQVKVQPINSPKGFRVLLSVEVAQNLIEKGTDTLNGETVNFAEDDPFCTVYIKVLGLNKPEGEGAKGESKLRSHELLSAFSKEGNV